MPAKKRKSAGQVAVKRLKRAPLDCGTAWGFSSEDVASALDWPALQSAFKELTAPALWANGLTHGKVADKLSIAASRGARLPLAAALGGETPSEVPEETESPGQPTFVVSSSIQLRDAPGKGRGWFSRRALVPGTLLLVERPLVASLDVEWRNKKWADCASADTVALGLELARAYSPSLGSLLAPFHPQESTESSSSSSQLQREDEEDDDPAALASLKAAVATAWDEVEGLSDAAKERLQAVVRLNSLGFYTNSEQLCHHGNFTALTGSGLFALASGFNHSCEPSVVRYSIGDITAFVTNRPVPEGEELCISYIESELLSAPQTLRSQSLNRDFTCQCTRCSAEVTSPKLSGSLSDNGARTFLRVDAQVQARLSLLQPQERVEAVEAALRGEMGDEDAEEGEEEEEKEKDEELKLESSTSGKESSKPLQKASRATVLMGKDAQELRVVQAIALMQMGHRKEALQVWRRLAAFSCHHCPPFDESLAVYATQAALCALAVADTVAADYVKLALEAHQAACGANLFRWRFETEVEESAAPADAKSEFWRLASAQPGNALRSFEEFVGAWRFAADEVPLAYEVFEASR